MRNEGDWLMHDHRRARRPVAEQRLSRSRDRRIAGVAGGVADFVGARPWTVRLLWLVSLPLSGGITGVAYLLLWLILPAAGATSGSAES